HARKVRPRVADEPAVRRAVEIPERTTHPERPSETQRAAGLPPVPGEIQAAVARDEHEKAAPGDERVLAPRAAQPRDRGGEEIRARRSRRRRAFAGSRRAPPRCPG